MAAEGIAVRTPLHGKIAIVDGGPAGLMMANLLGAAGIQATVLKANGGLLGLLRAIACNAEILRLLPLIGLLGGIEQGLIKILALSRSQA